MAEPGSAPGPMNDRDRDEILRAASGEHLLRSDGLRLQFFADLLFDPSVRAPQPLLQRDLGLPNGEPHEAACCSSSARAPPAGLARASYRSGSPPPSRPSRPTG